MKSIAVLMFVCVLICLNFILANGFSKGLLASKKESTRKTWLGHSRMSNNLSLKSGIFDRFWNVIRGQMDSLLSYFETPQKTIEQNIEDMTSHFFSVKIAYAELSESYQEALNRRNRLQHESVKLLTQADELIKAQQDELAKQALFSRQQIISQLRRLDEQIEIQSATLTKLKESIEASQIKLVEVKQEKDALIARAKIAEATVKANELLQSLSDDSIFTSSNQAYSRIKQQVSASEAKAAASAELVGLASTTFEKRYQDYQIQQNVDKDFKTLMEISKSPKEKDRI